MNNSKIIITGASGLVGQNLVLLMREKGYHHIIAIDKHEENLKTLKRLNPDVTTLQADLAVKGSWENHFENAEYVIMLHAQITGLEREIFVKNNITATENVLTVIKQNNIAFTIHISSSVVNSIANDDYTQTKIAQENLVKNSGIAHCILRPTLMFGWFDPKHLGWLSRLMEKMPIFPIPGHGKYMRQPLYSRDFCKIIIAALEAKLDQQIFDIVGQEKIDYIDMIRVIKKTKKLKTLIVKIPYTLFYFLLKLVALFNKNPPFTADQLQALTAGDEFTGINVEKTFGIEATRFSDAIHETFNHPIFSKIIIAR